jgi:hypothetical protein
VNADGALEVFGVGGASHVYHRFHRGNAWSDWMSLGGSIRKL